MKTSSIPIPGRVFQATVPVAARAIPAPVPDLPAEIAEHLARVLASPQFARARRDGPLLRYLVSASVGRASRRISEYAIGIDVYRRDPATYAPAEDPIVRVQMRRLRLRLARFYEGNAQQDAVAFSIPTGRYIVSIKYGLITTFQ